MVRGLLRVILSEGVSRSRTPKGRTCGAWTVSPAFDMHATRDDMPEQVADDIQFLTELMIYKATP